MNGAAFLIVKGVTFMVAGAVDINIATSKIKFSQTDIRLTLLLLCCELIYLAEIIIYCFSKGFDIPNLKDSIGKISEL